MGYKGKSFLDASYLFVDAPMFFIDGKLKADIDKWLNEACIQTTPVKIQQNHESKLRQSGNYLYD